MSIAFNRVSRVKLSDIGYEPLIYARVTEDNYDNISLRKVKRQ